MKVYVITTGSHSDYQIRRVLTDRVRAEKLVAVWNATTNYDIAQVQEWDTDEQPETLVQQWEAGAGELYACQWAPGRGFEPDCDIDGWTYEGPHPGKAMVTTATDRLVRVIGTDELVVRKTIYDTVTQVRARAEGIA